MRKYLSRVCVLNSFYYTFFAIFVFVWEQLNWYLRMLLVGWLVFVFGIFFVGVCWKGDKLKDNMEGGMAVWHCWRLKLFVQLCLCIWKISILFSDNNARNAKCNGRRCRCTIGSIKVDFGVQTFELMRNEEGILDKTSIVLPPPPPVAWFCSVCGRG